MRRVISLEHALVGAWLLGAAGCDQELVVPSSGPAATSERPTAPSGITGLGGEGSHATSEPPLPVKNEPSFTNFGGEGGDAGAADVAGAGGVTNAADGAGSAPGRGGTATAGASHSGGRTSTGGKSGASTDGGKSGASTDGGRSGASTDGGKSGADSGRGEAGDDAAGGSSAGANAMNGPRSLIFSAYLEGSGSNKALEISALAASSLEGCWLATYFNGKTEPAIVALHGSLAAGASLVLCSSALAKIEPARCQRSTNLTYNGDDALALACDGELLDVIGQIGLDPGVAWGAGATSDHTLRRNCQVSQGDANGGDFFDPALEWQVFPIDTVSDLGARPCTAP